MLFNAVIPPAVPMMMGHPQQQYQQQQQQYHHQQVQQLQKLAQQQEQRQQQSSSSSKSNSTTQAFVLLPPDFAPSKWAITCGRGKVYKNWPGNKRLESIVKYHLTAYSKAETKSQKSELVSLIMDQVLEQPKLQEGQQDQQGQDSQPSQSSPQPVLFVRYIHGRWYQIDDGESREKIGRMLRDRLHTQYRSSSKSKVAKRREANINKSKLRREAALKAAGAEEGSVSSTTATESKATNTNKSKTLTTKTNNKKNKTSSYAISAASVTKDHQLQQQEQAMRMLMMSSSVPSSSVYNNSCGGTAATTAASFMNTNPNTSICSILDQACDVVNRRIPTPSTTISNDHSGGTNMESVFLSMMNPTSSLKQTQQQDTATDDVLKLFGSSAPSSGDDEFDAFMNGDSILDLESSYDTDHLDTLIPSINNDIIVTVDSATDFDW